MDILTKDSKKSSKKNRTGGFQQLKKSCYKNDNLHKQLISCGFKIDHKTNIPICYLKILENEVGFSDCCHSGTCLLILGNERRGRR